MGAEEWGELVGDLIVFFGAIGTTILIVFDLRDGGDGFLGWAFKLSILFFCLAAVFVIAKKWLSLM